MRARINGWLGTVIFLFWALVPSLFGETASWPDYQVIMWVGDSAYKDPARVGLFFDRMREMGVTAVTVGPEGDTPRVLTNGFTFYIENIVNRGLCLKWNSHVRDWDRFVTEWAKNGRPDEALAREYCLQDPSWRAQGRKQMAEAARAARSGKPLLYNIRDELSVTISANPFDYDFSGKSLSGFRDWLRDRYPSLEALNHEWETKFASWDSVKPFTTDQIKNRMATGKALPSGRPDWAEVQQVRFDAATAAKRKTAWNFSPWADFRSFMDSSLANALGDFRDAAREIDPATPVGVEGTQMPSAWGGYDLWKMSQVVDWVEPYDIGNAREIFGSFMPGKPILTTVFENQEKMARRRLWHLLLEGDKGCLIWWSEDCIDYKSPDYPLSPKANALAPVLKELRGPLARLFMHAQPEHDPIAIHYSQPSIQVDWLIESTVDGSTWLRRFSSYESDHNRMIRVRDSWLKAMQDLGYSPEFVSSEQIEKGGLQKYRALILPESLALSDNAGARIRDFSKSGTVLCDGTPGVFDEHGKFRDHPVLGGMIPLANSEQISFAVSPGKTVERRRDISEYARDRLKGDMSLTDWLKENLPGMSAAARIPREARVRIHRYQTKGAELLALERNISYRMSEDLKQAGGNQALETPIETKIQLKSAGHVYDLRTGHYMGEGSQFKVHIDPWEPTLLAVFQQKLTGENPVAYLERD